MFKYDSLLYNLIIKRKKKQLLKLFIVEVENIIFCIKNNKLGFFGVVVSCPGGPCTGVIRKEFNI